MKRLNKKGFTLIELLAVIVILAILLAIAIPSVSKYINGAKKDTYIVNVKEYADAAQKELNLVDTDYVAPVNQGDYIIISFAALADTLEKGGKTSSYGGDFNTNMSFVVVVNEGTAAKPRYGYYIAAADSKGYAIGDGEAKSARVIKSDNLKSSNVVQVGKTGDNPNGIDKSSFTASQLVGLPSGVTLAGSATATY